MDRTIVLVKIHFQDNCGPLNSDNRYYQGFIDGCMSVEGNTREVCESSTDA